MSRLAVIEPATVNVDVALSNIKFFCATAAFALPSDVKT